MQVANISIICLILSQVGPRDAMLANDSTIHSEIHFTYTMGAVEPKIVDYQGIWDGRDIAFKEKPESTVLGEWCSDGRTQRFRCSPIRDVAEKIWAEAKAGDFLRVVPDISLLTDGKYAATLDYRVKTLQLEETANPSYMSSIPGPYFRMAGRDLHAVVKENYSNSPIKRFMARRDGKPYEVEVFRKERDNGWEQLVVHYDPSIGYLPRFCRTVSFSSDKKRFSVLEYLLISTIHTKSGGFLPERLFKLQFKAKFSPQLDESTFFSTSDFLGPVAVSRFVVDKYRDIEGPIMLDIPAGVGLIKSSGGEIGLGKAATSLTLDGMVASAGSKLTTKLNRPTVNLDLEEIKEEARLQKTNHSKTIFAVSLACIILLFLARRKIASKFTFVSLVLLSSSGCSPVASTPSQNSLKPVDRILAAFSDPFLLLDFRTSSHG